MTDPSTSAAGSAQLRETPLGALHRELGGKMVPFAGYLMPVQFPDGILKEHRHTRAAAGLFDVSHMGQLRLEGEAPWAALESLVPGDILGLRPGQMRYTQFTNENGGILDDLMVTRFEDHLFLVVNAACKAEDTAHLRQGLAGRVEVRPLEDRALLALQGPEAAAVLGREVAAGLADLHFMQAAEMTVGGIPCLVSRSGYTGEDGFELSVAAEQAEALARRLLADPRVRPVGLGARDSLRLEAGLCLYGHDLDPTTTPVEAALTWSIGKRRRQEGGFPGDAVIRQQLQQGAPRKRVGIRPEGRAPAREGAEIVAADGTPLGRVTSGGFGPSVNGPIAMGYVPKAAAAAGTAIGLMVRGSLLPAQVSGLPFVPQHYYRG